jgi:hypothetical protein
MQQVEELVHSSLLRSFVSTHYGGSSRYDRFVVVELVSALFHLFVTTVSRSMYSMVLQL